MKTTMVLLQLWIQICACGTPKSREVVSDVHQPSLLISPAGPGHEKEKKQKNTNNTRAPTSMDRRGPLPPEKTAMFRSNKQSAGACSNDDFYLSCVCYRFPYLGVPSKPYMQL